MCKAPFCAVHLSKHHCLFKLERRRPDDAVAEYAAGTAPNHGDDINRMPPPSVPVHRRRPKIPKAEVKEEIASPSSVAGVPINDDPLSLFTDIVAAPSVSAAGVPADDALEAHDAAAAESAARKREDRCDKPCDFCGVYACDKAKEENHDVHDCGDCNRPDLWRPTPPPPVPPPVRPPNEAPRKIAP